MGGDLLHDPVEQVVADEGSGGVADRGGDPGHADGFGHFFHRQVGETGGGSAGGDGDVLGLVALVVGDGGVVQVHGHPFKGDLEAAAGLAHADDGVGSDAGGFGVGQLLGGPENRGDQELMEPVGAPVLFQPGDHLPGGVDGRAAKGIECGKQNIHGFLLDFFENKGGDGRVVGAVPEFRQQDGEGFAVDGAEVGGQGVFFLEAAVAAVVDAEAHDAAGL